MFKEKGASVIDADEIAHSLMEPKQPLYDSVMSLFGMGVLEKLEIGSPINRKKVADIVFNDENKLKLFNSVIHPVIIDKIKELLNKGEEPKSGVYIIDAPLLIETRLEEMVGKLIVVTASPSKQLERAKKKWRMNAKDIKSRIASQIPLDEKKEKADFIIDNNGSLKKTREQVTKIWRKIKDGTARSEGKGK